MTKIIDPSPMAKIDLFSGLREKRRTPRATSRPLDQGSTRYLRGRHLQSLALSDTKGVGRGLIQCRDRSLSSRELFLISVQTILNVNAQVPPRGAA